MIRWIRGSLRIEFFIFLITWGIFFEWWELDLQLLPSFFFSSYETSFFFFFPETVESNYFLLAHILRMNESHDPGRPFKVAITTSTFFTSSLTASSCSFIWETLMTAWSLHSRYSYSSTGFLRSSYDVCSSLQIAWSRNQTSSMYLGNTLVVQVDSKLNHQWSSGIWRSSSSERFLASSPSETGSSMLM